MPALFDRHQIYNHLLSLKYVTRIAPPTCTTPTVNRAGAHPRPPPPDTGPSTSEQPLSPSLGLWWVKKDVGLYICGEQSVELSGLNLQDKHGPLTPSPSAGRPQMLINRAGVYGLPSELPIHSIRGKSQGLVSPSLPLTYELSKLL